jgi:hypothetical protein
MRRNGVESGPNQRIFGAVRRAMREFRGKWVVRRKWLDVREPQQALKGLCRGAERCFASA